MKKIIKTILLLVIGLVLIQGVFAANSAGYRESTGKEFYFDAWISGANADNGWALHKLVSPLILEDSSVNAEYTFAYESQDSFAYTFQYPIANEDFVLSPGPIDMLKTYGVEEFALNKYLPDNNMLTENKCVITNLNLNDNIVSLDSNLLTFKVYTLDANGNKVLGELEIPAEYTQYFEELKDKYYYMKADLKVELLKDGNVLETYSSTDIKTRAGYSNFVTIKPGTNAFSFELLTQKEITAKYGSGNYEWNIIATPIDKKCDLGMDGSLDGDIVENSKRIEFEINGNEASYKEINGRDFYFDAWISNANEANGWALHKLGSLLLQGDSSVNAEYTFTYYPEDSFAYTFQYPVANEDFVLSPAPIDMLKTYGVEEFALNKYLADNNMLTESKCVITDLNLNNNVISLDSNLLTFKVYTLDANGNKVLGEPEIPEEHVQYFEELKDKYYYTKADLKADLIKDGTVVATYYPTTATSRAGYSNFVTIKPDVNEYAFTLPNEDTIKSTFGAGTYSWSYSVTPIDMKCDFDGNNVLDLTTEVEGKTIQGGSFVIEATPVENEVLSVIITSPRDNSVIETNSVTLQAEVTTTLGESVDVSFIVDGTAIKTVSPVESNGVFVAGYIAQIAQGTHTLIATAGDVESAQVTFTVDLPEDEVLSIDLISPVNNAFIMSRDVSLEAVAVTSFGEDVSLTFVGDSNVLSAIDTTSGVNTAYNWMGISEGKHFWKVSANGVESSEFAFNIAFPPVESNSRVEPASPTIYSPTLEYNFSMDWNDDSGLSRVVLVFDGKEYEYDEVSGNTYSVTLTGIEAGDHSYFWKATDVHGNTRQTLAQDYVVLDRDQARYNGLLTDEDEYYEGEDFEGVRIQGYMKSALTGAISDGFNTLEVTLNNRDPVRKKVRVSAISRELGISKTISVTINANDNINIQIPVYVKGEVEPGQYPVRIIIDDGYERKSKYSYLNIN